MEGRVDRGRQQRVTETTTLGHKVEGLQSFLTMKNIMLDPSVSFVSR